MTKQKVKIFYCRTNKISSLEEENLRLFIHKSKEYFNLKDIFDDKNEQVFSNPNNSHIVLNSIARMSEKFKNVDRRFKTIKEVSIYCNFYQFHLHNINMILETKTYHQ